MTASLTLPVFAADQSAARVDASLRQALEACDRAQECAALWFAEVQRRALYRELGYASLQLYATQSLGFTDNRYWQFKRLADDLERLPALREAVASGAMGWTKAQQVARVATAETQDAWVAKAASCGRRELATVVQAAVQASRVRRDGDADRTAQLVLGTPSATLTGAIPAGETGRTAAAIPAGDIPVTITLRADGLQLARFEALLEKARRLRVMPDRADRLDLVLAGLEALIGAADAAGQPVNHAAAGQPRRTAMVQVVVQQCPDCAAAAAVTSRGEKRLAPAQVAAALCDARVREPGRRNRATIPPSVRASVLARDRHRCAAPGCRSAHFLEVHHVQPRRLGGSNRPQNLITLCTRCHAFAHEHGEGFANIEGLAPAQGDMRCAEPGDAGRSRAEVCHADVCDAHTCHADVSHADTCGPVD